MSSKILVVGSGKCGTTYFMKLLSELGFDTGFDAGDSSDMVGYKGETPYHGFEWEIRGKHARQDRMPCIIKSPKLCVDMLERAERWDWQIEHVYILLRKYEDVGSHYWRYGGARHIKTDEEKFLKEYAEAAAQRVGNAVQNVVTANIPYTFLMFPRIVAEPLYLWSHCPLLADNISYETFRDAFDKVADVDLVHWGLEKEKT